MVSLEYGMGLALEQAQKARDKGEVPVGAVLLSQTGDILAKAHNIQPHILGHAEVLTLLQCDGPYVPSGSILFVTLEPCPMCIGAIANARVDKLVFGAYDVKGGAVDHGMKACSFLPFPKEVIGGVMQEECATLMKGFFQQRRF